MLNGPRTIHAVNNMPEYFIRQAKSCQQFKTTPHVFLGPCPLPYVSHGRWVLDCPCGNGCAVDPYWGIALCFECGAQFSAIPIPPMIADIEQLLGVRPMSQRNWFPHESVDALVRENVKHNLPVPASVKA
jgi:hypothetical protein